MNGQDYTIGFESLIDCKVTGFDESANLLYVEKEGNIKEYYLSENEETLFLSSQKIKPCSIKRSYNDSMRYDKISGNNNIDRNPLSFIIGSEIYEVKPRFLKDMNCDDSCPCGVKILSIKDGRKIMHDLVSLEKGWINISVSLH